MSSQKQEEILTQPSEVSKFYAGKSVFITGAAGFLGVVMLEILLRCCPDIIRIYILLRPKKGVQPEDRKEGIFKKDIFNKLREKNPDVLKKVVVIPGDVSSADLEMSASDLLKVSQEVSVVFHCASSISFIKTLKFMMLHNFLGTNNVIEFCRKLSKLEVLVYTSTAYSNSNILSEIEERIYKLPFSVEDAMEMTRKCSDEELMSLFSKCQPKFPNYYTFTKCLTENLLAEKASDLPVCIIRPSIIVCTLKGILPGYIEDTSGITSLSIGIGKGFIRVIKVDPDKKVNHIPADIVANTHIIAAYRQATESLLSPSMYNCVADETCQWTWAQFTRTLFEMVVKHPLPKSYQKPHITLCKNPIKYWFISVFDHYAPAVVIDLLLWLSGRKARLLRLYRFYDKSMSALEYFTMREFNFKCENFMSIGDKLNTTDLEIFPVDLKDFNLEEISRCVLSGAPVYKRNVNDKDYEEQIRANYRRYYISSIIKWSVLGCIVSIFFLLIF